MASDGTVLTIKEGGDYKYKRSDIRKNIVQVMNELGTEFDWGYGWTPE